MKFGLRFSRVQLFRLGLVAAMATGVVGTVAGHGTTAYFSSTVVSNTNTFSAGNLHLQIADKNNVASAGPVSTTMTLSTMKPGDVVYAPIYLTNVGSINAKWGIKYTTAVAAGSTADLADALQVSIFGKGSGSAASDGSDCKSGQLGSGKWAEQIVPTWDTMVAGPTVTTYVDYQATTAPHVADRTYDATDLAAPAYLTMAPTTGADIVCIGVQFPSAGWPANNTAGDNAWNGASDGYYGTSVTFTFEAGQRVLSTESDQY
jgi:predicted ribosomally synthesized peptide with SipW-like signal peptide